MAIQPNEIFGQVPETVANAEAAAAGVRVYAIQLNGGSDAALVTLTNTGGSEITRVKAAANVSILMDYTQLGGIPFADGCTIALTGTAVTCQVWANKAFA